MYVCGVSEICVVCVWWEWYCVACVGVMICVYVCVCVCDVCILCTIFVWRCNENACILLPCIYCIFPRKVFIHYASGLLLTSECMA